MKRFLILLTFCTFWQYSFAYDFSAVSPSGHTLFYNIVNGNAQVTFQSDGLGVPNYSSPFSGCLIIPDSVVCNGTTYMVTSIGYAAFRRCNELTSVVIPNTVVSINDAAFQRCSGITSISIPDSLTFIGSYAFNACSTLTSIVIPASITSIGQSTFRGCSSLTTPNTYW